MTAELEHPGSQAFHNRIHDNHMYGLWELASQMTAHPTPRMIPFMWKWELIESVLQESGEVVPIGNERRAFVARVVGGQSLDGLSPGHPRFELARRCHHRLDRVARTKDEGVLDHVDGAEGGAAQRRVPPRRRRELREVADE